MDGCGEEQTKRSSEGSLPMTSADEINSSYLSPSMSSGNAAPQTTEVVGEQPILQVPRYPKPSCAWPGSPPPAKDDASNTGGVTQPLLEATEVLEPASEATADRAVRIGNRASSPLGQDVKEENVGEEAVQDAFDCKRTLRHLDDTLTSLRLIAIQVEDWLLFQRKDFDLRVQEEPFHGLHVLFCLSNGAFRRRVWGKTVQKGQVSSLPQLVSLLQAHFKRTVPCLGFYDFSDGFSMSREDLVAVEYPMPRVISKDCVASYVIPEDGGGEDYDGDGMVGPTVSELLGVGLCSMCAGMKQQERPDEETLKEEVANADDDPDYEPGHDTDGDGDDNVSQSDTATNPNEAEHSQYEKRRGMTSRQRASRDSDDEGADVESEKKPSVRRGGGRRGRAIVRGEDGKRVYLCTECDKTFNQPRSLDRHMEVFHLAGDFDCHLCQHAAGFTCKLANELYRHFTSEHPEENFTCMSCSEASFAPEKEAEFVAHYKTCYRNKERNERRRKRMNKPSNLDKKKPHQCELCGKTFAARTTFVEHTNWHKGLKPIQCPDCDFTTCFSTSLYTHSKIHLRERGLQTMNGDIPLTHTCQICGNRYNQANQLRTHIKRVHDGVVERRDCDVCGAVFTNRQNLRRHVAREHPRDPSLRCNLCGHISADRYAFNLHQRVHREPDFMCRFCGKAVKSKQTLQAHERSHTGENPYACDLCDYACKSSSVLNRHKQAKHNQRPGPPRAPRNGRSTAAQQLTTSQMPSPSPMTIATGTPSAVEASVAMSQS